MTRRYLVIDDNRAFAENVAEILTDAGAHVSVEADAEAALDRLKQERFDGVVTDMKMPGLSGAGLIRHLRELDAGLPVVLMSAWSQPEQLDEARRFGLLAFLGKAGDTPRLVRMLERARRDAIVVLLEDDHALADNLSEALAFHGFTVCVASSLAEFDALEVQPRAALVDLRLPGVPDGASLGRVKARFPQAVVIAVTGLPDAVPAGVEVISKPFDTTKLIARLELLVPR